MRPELHLVWEGGEQEQVIHQGKALWEAARNNLPGNPYIAKSTLLSEDDINEPEDEELVELWELIRDGLQDYRLGLFSCGEGTEKRVRFLRNSPSMKVMSPWIGLTSPDQAGSKTQDTDTSPK
ncbi:hypothetical protein F7725_012481 [Dissostichus mawsoni]|uniref:Uncharacterized protein n=1 Tax=Dissostichus mawsoni TaxID=36200 RepID=A0A7J5YPP0_DISMA|nr:hypothetical protein F7725_012481 [Dissostichus mawsoni]